MPSRHLAIETIPVLPTLNAVVLPGVETALDVGRTATIHAVDAADRGSKKILIVPQRDVDVLVPRPPDLHDIGVLAEILEVDKNGPRRYTVRLHTTERYRVTDYVATHPYLLARAERIVDDGDNPEDLDQGIAALKDALTDLLSQETSELHNLSFDIELIDEPEYLLSVVATQLDLSRAQRIDILTATSTKERLHVILPIVERMRAVLRMKQSIDVEISEDISRSERERALRLRMRAIREELGEADSDDDLDEYRQRVAESGMTDEARRAATRQIGRMSHMSASSPEYNVARTYVETLLEIPWGKYTEDTLDVQHAREILDQDHSGLEKVKKRILEFIAVRKLAPDKHGPILCMVGPPGVGKTSLGRSIARALSREYVRAALGGVRDEATIRGHRRTYIGSIPGRIASSLAKVGSMNPVFVLDEIDKLGADHRGDPSSALLEVLDPEQNHAFSDHYLEVELDLSRVMFIATANTLETIPAPLLDRMEVIRLPGYTAEEKRVIATEHLWPKQLIEHGLDSEQVTIDDDALTDVIAHYTREAGVRNLERELAALCRHAAVEVAGRRDLDKLEVAGGDLDKLEVAGRRDLAKLEITRESLYEPLGPVRYHSELADREPEIGISTGLAWTPTGGSIMFIEARSMPGTGKLELTGQLGGIMNESATAAFSWVRANAKRLGLDGERLAKLDIHMHIPAGAVRKDGPSAGIAIATALVSLLGGRKVRNDVAITGEITLRGLSLPVGGIKEKVLAAHRAGIKVVLLPERNQKDLEDIPEDVRTELDIRFVKRVDEALDLALVPATGSMTGAVDVALLQQVEQGSVAEPGVIT